MYEEQEEEVEEEEREKDIARIEREPPLYVVIHTTTKCKKHSHSFRQEMHESF